MSFCMFFFFWLGLVWSGERVGVRAIHLLICCVFSVMGDRIRSFRSFREAEDEGWVSRKATDERCYLGFFRFLTRDNVVFSLGLSVAFGLKD